MWYECVVAGTWDLQLKGCNLTCGCANGSACAIGYACIFDIVVTNFVNGFSWLWLPCVAAADIIFCPVVSCIFFLLFFS